MKKHKISYRHITFAAKALLVLSLFFVFLLPSESVYAKKKSEQIIRTEYFKSDDMVWKTNVNTYTLDCMQACLKVNREIVNNQAAGMFLPKNSIAKKFAKCLVNNLISSKATLMFTGDLMCLRGQQYSAEIKGGYDFSPSFEFVAPLFKSADFVCCNLETLISKSNPTTKQQNYINGQPQCNGPVEYLDAIKNAGVNAVVTANNHCCDWGAVGITETKDRLSDYNIPNIGTNYEDTADRFLLFDVNNIKVAVLSYTHLVNQRSKMSAYELDTMVNCYDAKMVKKDIKAAKKAGAEFVVVYSHWGVENTEQLNYFQTNDSKDIAEFGADLIIGSHPHCLQKCEYITTSDGREVLCMYSMGNFVSSMAREINNDTIILNVNLKKNIFDNCVTVENISYIPCYVTSYKGRNNVIIPIQKELNGNLEMNSLKNSFNRITKILKNIDVYEVQT